MKKQSLTIAFTVMFLLFTETNLLNAAQQQENAPEGPTFSDLALEITTSKDAFNPLEPIPLTIILSNKTDQPILGHAALDFTYNHIHLFVNPIGGERRRIQDLSMIHKFVSPSPFKIKPGEAFPLKQLIDIDLDKIFPYPGEYQLQAELLDVDGKKTIKSNHVRIRIIEPAGLDRQALDFIKNNSNPSYFLNGYERIVNKKPLSILEEFVSRFSETAYGNYATFQLGEVYLSKRDYEKAIKHLEKLAKKSDFVFAERVKDYLDKAKEKIEHKKTDK